MKAKDLDRKFDQDKEDIVEHLDLSTMRQRNQDQKRVDIEAVSSDTGEAGTSD
jgi:hypothetical protein